MANLGLCQQQLERGAFFLLYIATGLRFTFMILSTHRHKKRNKETNWLKEGGRKNWNPIPPPVWSHQVSEKTNWQSKATCKPRDNTRIVSYIHRNNAAKGPDPSSAKAQMIPVRLLKAHFTNLWKTSNSSKILIYNKKNKSCSSLCIRKGSQSYKAQYCVYGQLIYIQLLSFN